MYNDVITLIKKASVTNEYGAAVETIISQRDVFCNVASIGMKESYEALAVGKHPEIKAIIADYLDYDGERYAVLNDVEYTITRTYRKGIELELTLERVNDNVGA